MTQVICATSDASGSLKMARIKAAASNNLTSVKGAASDLYGYALYNNSAAAKYVKFYDKATAPVVANDTPKFTVVLAANGKAEIMSAIGVAFLNGIAYAVTGAVGDTDATNTSADDVHGSLFYF